MLFIERTSMASIYKEIVILSSVFLEMDLFFTFQSESLLHRMLQNYSKQANNIFEQLTQSCEVLQSLFLLCNDFGNCISQLRRHFFMYGSIQSKTWLQ